MAKEVDRPSCIWQLILVALKRLGYILRRISDVGFEKTETFALKPVKIFPTPVEFVFRARFGVKINVAIVGINDVLFLTRSQFKPAAGLPVFGLTFPGQLAHGNVDGATAIIFNENL